MNPSHILVFDSGVGGLSIVEHIRHLIPGCQITYLADNALFPYGMLGEEHLVERVTRLLLTATEQLRPELIVVGCNSASTLVLPQLRAQLSIPVVGVVPAIKPAAKTSATNVVGLLATPGTIGRGYTDELISDYANHCEVIRVGSAELVAAIEGKMRGIPIDRQACEAVIKPFRDHPLWPKLDTIVLACTHFPLAIEELSQSAPEIKHWVDSGAAIARRVESLLADRGTGISKEKGRDLALFTDTSGHTPALEQQLKKYGFGHSEQWPASH
jgi:glutamate racemase